jgi:hypothetical protein
MNSPAAPETTPGVPSIRWIQTTNLVLVFVSAGVMAYFVSEAAAVGCLVGGAVVIANMFLLAVLGRFALSAAERSGGATRMGMAALPLKLLLFVALVYVVFARVHLSGIGFALGVLTQMTAIIIETGRTWFAQKSN